MRSMTKQHTLIYINVDVKIFIGLSEAIYLNYFICIHLLNIHINLLVCPRITAIKITHFKF